MKRLVVPLLLILTAGCFHADESMGIEQAVIKKVGKTTASFLHPDDASVAIVDDGGEYFSRLRPREIKVKTKGRVSAAPSTSVEQLRENTKSAYANATLRWNNNEIALVTMALDKVQPYLEDNFPLLSQEPWSFIKVEDWVESGLVHTRGSSHIIFPSFFVGDIAEMGGSDGVEAMAKFLLHERPHNFQRTHPRDSDELYASWGFLPAADLKVADDYISAQMLNPDGLDVWLIRNGEDLIWPTMLVDENDKPNYTGILVHQDESGFRTKPEKVPLGDLQQYTETFDLVVPMLCHPNEISAELFAIAAHNEIYGRPNRFALSQSTLAWFKVNLREEGS